MEYGPSLADVLANYLYLSQSICVSVCICIGSDLSNIRVTFKIQFLVKCLAKQSILSAIHVGFLKPNGVRKHTHIHRHTHTHKHTHMSYYGYFVNSFSVFQVEKTSMPTDFIKPSKCN